MANNVVISAQKIQLFRAEIWKFFRVSGRYELPWRKTKDPYKILVSEVMLQQTQVSRVLSKYAEFLNAYPTVESLARAPLGDVLKVWQGLGYNRRAKFLHQLAQVVVAGYGGRLPHAEAELLKLPGIGKATAAAIMAFAFNQPVLYLETNVRSVFLHHFFHNAQGVADAELLPLIARAAESQDPRTWNWALLDYGVYVKATYGNPNLKSKHYTKQTKFQGSNRQLRGQILRLLSEGSLTSTALLAKLGYERARAVFVLQALLQEGLVTKQGQRLRLG